MQSVERAAAILRLLAAEGRPVSLAHVSSALALAKPTAHGLVQTLREVGFVDQDPATGHYAISTGLLELGAVPVDLNEVRSLALNWADSLAAHTGLEALVVVHADGQALVAHHVFRPDGSTQELRTGAALPLHATAFGKVLLAHDLAAVRALAAHGLGESGELEMLTHRTITDQTRLAHELADVRDNGWAQAVEESEVGQAALAAPVRDRNGVVIAALGVQGRVHETCGDGGRPRPALVEHVTRSARAVSRAHGHGQGR